MRRQRAALAEALSLPRNLALMAGAGAGKTYSLVTICLHLLGGARERDEEALSCSRLCLVTFTDKAAAELRARLRARLDRLATGAAGPEEERDLRESFSSLGRPFPPRETWRRLRDDLGAATIGTFHSLCVQLLRRAPGGLGLDPAFGLLEERDARSLIHDTAERLVLEALEVGEEPVVELCRELGFVGQGKVNGLVDHLCEVFTQVREEGVSPLVIPISDEARERAELERAVRELKELVGSAQGALSPEHRRRFGSLLDACRVALDGLSFDNFLEPGRFPKLREAVQERALSNQRGPGVEALKQVKWRIVGHKQREILGLADHYAGCLVAPHERAFVSLLERLRARHREELARRAALDFSELLIRTRDLLRDHPDFRADVQERLGALLVDEFQDTNRLQLELVTLLAERRAGAPREVAEVLELPLEPAFLCAVGDRKQSIYEFRGADVSVFGVLAQKLEAEGGGRSYLQENRRSSPELIELFNRVFREVMRPRQDAKEYEVAYEPGGDDLRPVRSSFLPGPCADRIVYQPEEDDRAEDCRAADADAIARYLRALLSGRTEVRVAEEGGSRPPLGGDVAILFRRFVYLETYRQALTRHGVPHRVVRGRGFYGAQEVLDLASLLSLVADPEDSVSLAAVLRSPLVALSDASLFELAHAGGGRLGLRSIESGRSIPSEERERLDRFLELYPALRKEKDRLGLRVLLGVAIEETGFRVALAGTPFGEQALANLDKLLELAGRWDKRGIGECAAFARELLRLAETDPTEAQADVLDAQDPRAVQLLTIHQAKGLEWPIVVVPDLGAKPFGRGERIAFDREHGLAIRPWLGEGQQAASSPRFRRVSAELRRRQQAEYLRLLYVALTRARDRLVLSGAGRGSDHWWGLLDSAISGDERLRALVRDLPPDAPLPLPLGEGQGGIPATTPADLARVERVVARVRSPVPLEPRSIVLPVTQLQDYFRCPRRYFYAHHVGLSEFPVVFELDEEEGQGGAGGDSRRKGTLAHRLLERAPLEAIGRPELRKTLSALLWEEGLDPKGADGREILGWVERFLSGPFGRRLAEAGAARVHRELPFLLRLGGEGGSLAVHLRGQIDLLFEGEDGDAWVVDYKASERPMGGLSAYEFQLDCYALAAARFVRDGVPVKTGIAFLREKRSEPELRNGAPDRDGLEVRLVGAARELLADSARHEWSGRARPDCERMGCGYRYRCHPVGST